MKSLLVLALLSVVFIGSIGSAYAYERGVESSEGYDGKIKFG